ncbi:MAG: diguanylate cyclase [Motiliproteus sp.]
MPNSCNSSDHVVARKIVLPLILLIVSVVISIVMVLFYSAEKADIDASAASEVNTQQVLVDKRNQLAMLAKDYAYWSDTVAYAYQDQDLVWIEKNIGSYLTDTFGISDLFLISQADEMVLALRNGLPVDWSDTGNIGQDLGELASRARESGAVPEPISAIMVVDGFPSLVGVAVLAYDDDRVVPVSDPRPVLFLIKRFDETLLSGMAESFGLNQLQTLPVEPDDHASNLASINLYGVHDKLLGRLAWLPSLPGTSVINFIKLPLSISLALIALIGFYITRGSVATARQLDEANRQTTQLNHAIEQTHCSIFIANRSGALAYANTQCLNLFQSTANGVVGTLSELIQVGKYPRLHRALMSAFNDGVSWDGEFEHQAVDGTRLWLHASITPNCDDEQCDTLVCVVTDISDMKQAFDEMAHLASHDVLTGLVNRRLFRELLDQTINLSRRDNSRSALLYLDLDDFKEVNDTLGHAVGDQLLIGVAERLKHNVRESDTVARVGGDEFIVLLHNTESRDAVEHTVINILTHLAQPLDIAGHQVKISGSAGIAMIPDEGLDADDLIKKADLALYQCKSKGGNSYIFFSERMARNEWPKNRLADELDRLD